MDRPSLVQSTPNGVEQPGYLSSDKENHRPNSSKHSASTVSSRSGSNMDKALPPTPAELSRETERPKTSVKYDEYEVRPSLDGRPSSQSLRASTRDLHSAHGYKPKVKLGPRPSTDSRSRPPTANPSSRATDTRPISTLPAGLSMPVRKAVSATPKSPQSQVHPHIMDSIASNLQSAPLLPTKTPPTKTEPTKSTKRPTSGLQGDLRAPAQGPSPKTPTMTPEKRRLMKALQLRQKQMAAQSFQETFEDKPVPAAADAQPSTKSTHEDSIMKRSVDVFSVDEDSNIVHVGMKVFDKELPVNSEVSPISITEPSDGPSTQASSISDEDETSAKQEKTTGMTESSEQHADIELMSAGSYGENPMPKASSSPQSPETYIKEEDTKKTASELERPPIHAPFTGERPVLPIEPDTLQNSALPTESPPKIVSSFLRSTSDVISPQEVLVPAISEDDDPSLGPLELSYTDMNVLLPFLSQNTAPQVPHVQVTSHTRDEDEIRTNPRPSTADTIADDRQHHGPILSVKRVSETSDENFLSDDSFMEELKDAVVQEAKPISVSKSPITPVFPRRGSDLGSEHGRTARSVSNPLRRTSREDLLSPNQQMPLSARSFSIPESQNFATKPTQILLPTKVGVSSGISQRIKALEKLSSRPPSPSGSQHTSSTTSPPYINLRKSSLRSTPAAPDPPKYSGHKSRQSVPYHSPSPPPPPEADLTKSMDPPILETSSKRGKSRPESISVTAKIIRGGRNQVPEVPLNPSEPCAVDLYQSPLTVDHQPREGTSKPELSPLKPPTRQWASNMSISSSSTEHQSEPTKASRRDSFMSRRSMSSRRGSDVDLRRSISETSLATLTMDGKKGERKDSKKSRLFKRMSNISSASRRSIVQALSPTLKEESIAERHEPVYEAPRTTIDVGDINVQFPDTLVGIHSSLMCFSNTKQSSSYGNAGT